MTTDTLTTVGTVSAIWRYPVKSMMGEEIEAAEITEKGIVGDRGYALVDSETGKVVSAKSPRRWGKMFEFKSAYLEEPEVGKALPLVRITLPDGEQITSGEFGTDGTLSKLLGREVKLVESKTAANGMFDHYWTEDQTPLGPPVENTEGDSITALPLGFAAPGTVLDYSALHLLTTSTLERLNELYPDGRWEARRFRPNIVVASDQSGFAEDAWISNEVTLGNEVRAKIIDPMVRCVMTTLPQEGLPSDPGILKTVASHHRVLFPLAGKEMPSVGVAVSVLAGGEIRRGDTVRLDSAA